VLLMNARSSRTSSFYSPSTLPFSQSDVSVDPHFYCHLRYVEDGVLSWPFLLYLITFASYFPGYPRC
jgi:hypothetical protein